MVGPQSTLQRLPSAFRWTQAREAGLTDPALQQLVRDGVLDRIGHGAYVKATAGPVDFDLVEIALISEAATLCLATSLARHDLTDQIPSRLETAIPRGKRSPKTVAPVRWHHFAPETFEIGRERFAVLDQLQLGIYNAQRSIIDAYRLRHHEGPELGREALRRWLDRRGSQPGELLQMAQHFPKATRQLRTDLELLL